MCDDGDPTFSLVGILVSIGIHILAAMNALSQRSADVLEVNFTLPRMSAVQVQITYDGSEPIPALEIIVSEDGTA